MLPLKIVYYDLVIVLHFELHYRIYQPLLLATLLRNFSNNRDEWSNEAYYCAAGMILLPFLDCFIVHYTMHCIMHIGLRIKIACTSLIYQKILKLSNSVLDHETSVGQVSCNLLIVNLDN